MGDLCPSEAAAVVLARCSTEPKRTLDAYVYTAESYLALFQAISSVKIFDDFAAVLMPNCTDLSTCLCLRCDCSNICMLRTEERRRNSQQNGVNYEQSVLTLKIYFPSQNWLIEFLEVTA